MDRKFNTAHIMKIPVRVLRSITRAIHRILTPSPQLAHNSGPPTARQRYTIQWRISGATARQRYTIQWRISGGPLVARQCVLADHRVNCDWVNPFKPNGISHSYQLDQSIYILRVVGWYFSFFLNFKRILYKQAAEP